MSLIVNPYCLTPESIVNIIRGYLSDCDRVEEIDLTPDREQHYKAYSEKLEYRYRRNHGDYLGSDIEKVIPRGEREVYLETLFKSSLIQYIPLPDELFSCPIDSITFNHFSHCEITPCGHTFSQSGIHTMLNMGQNFCPIDRLPMSSDTLRKNRVISSLMASPRGGPWHEAGFGDPETLMRVFIEIQDIRVASFSSSELNKFNEELFLRVQILDERCRRYETIAKRLIQFNPHENYYVARCGHTITKRDLLLLPEKGCCELTRGNSAADVLAASVKNRFLEEAISWATKYYASSPWSKRSVETLPGKAGVFLHFYPSTLARTIVREFARLGVFNKELQMIAAVGSEDMAAAIDKFSSIEEMRKAFAMHGAAFQCELLPRLYFNPELFTPRDHGPEMGFDHLIDEPFRGPDDNSTLHAIPMRKRVKPMRI